MRSESAFRRTGKRALVGCFLVGVGVVIAWPSVLGGVAPWSDALGPEGPTESTIRRGDVTVTPAFESLHRRGVTGSGVDVGVLDVTGFDADHPAVSERIDASRAFGDATVDDGEPPRHGTAVATALGRLAPDASLHLAVAHDADGVVAAAEWLAERDVDVVVAPFNSLSAPDDGTSRVSRALSRLRVAGVVVVASAGNFGQSHWAGRLAPTEDGRHRFGASATRNRVYPAPWAGTRPTTVDVWLTWNGSRFPRDLNLRLYRLSRDGRERVATADRVSSGDNRREYLGITLPAGQYYLVVDIPERSRPVADDVPPRIEVTASGVTLDRTTPRGSVAAPATAPGVVGVGVAAPNGAVYPHSSQGPTTDGRRGVDVVAPATPFANVTTLRPPGTSAAATYVGAVTALVAERHPAASAAAIERRVVRTATATNRTSPDVVAGYGRVSPTGAVSSDRAGGSTAATDTGARTPENATKLPQRGSPDAPERDTHRIRPITGAEFHTDWRHTTYV